MLLLWSLSKTMMGRLFHDLVDASKVWAAALLGWTVTVSDLHLVIKLLIAIATLVYMIGKGIVVWRQILKTDVSDDEKNL
jgi:hypothetical protein